MLEQLTGLAKEEGMPLSLHQAGRFLADHGHDVVLRRSKLQPTNFHQSLQHQFLVVKQPAGLPELVVELSLPEHFSLPMASQGFQTVLEGLPTLFVGLPSQLLTLTRAFSHLMALEYESQVRR